MGLYITEHGGAGNYRQPINQAPLAAYYLSTTSNPVSQLQSGTKYIRVSADAGHYLNNSQTSSGAAALTSTNSFRIPANVSPELFSVSTAFKLQMVST